MRSDEIGITAVIFTGCARETRPIIAKAIPTKIDRNTLPVIETSSQSFSTKYHSVEGQADDREHTERGIDQDVLVPECY